VWRAGRAILAVSKVTAARSQANLIFVISGGLSPIVSATPERLTLTGAASGSVNALLVHVTNLGASGQTQESKSQTAAGGM
jgi:glycerate-2-kinase